MYPSPGNSHWDVWKMREVVSLHSKTAQTSDFTSSSVVRMTLRICERRSAAGRLFHKQEVSLQPVRPSGSFSSNADKNLMVPLFKQSQILIFLC